MQPHIYVKFLTHLPDSISSPPSKVNRFPKIIRCSCSVVRLGQSSASACERDIESQYAAGDARRLAGDGQHYRRNNLPPIKSYTPPHLARMAKDGVQFNRFYAAALMELTAGHRKAK